VIDYAHTRISLALHLLPFNVWFFPLWRVRLFALHGHAAAAAAAVSMARVVDSFAELFLLS
jgi:hypothetical protein